jgi:pyruvyltransferase
VVLFSFRGTAVIKAYWWKEVPNFGDALTPLLLEHFTDLKVEWGPISHSQVISVGSILEHVPPLWDGYILGSGRLLEHSRTNLVGMTSGMSAKILSLRGPLSARGIPGKYTFGDPGVLADELVGYQEPKWELGIVPHFKDTKLVDKFVKLIPKKFSIKVINPQDDPIEVIKQIGASKRIVTSSLHGMIVADAFGLPRRVEICEETRRDGGDFKFRDYSASIKMEFKPGVMMCAQRFRVEDVKYAVYDAFRELESFLK